MKHNPFKVLIISCWTMLGVCFILKLFGATIFDAGTESNTIINIFAFIDNRLWIKQIIACVICLILASLVILAVLKQKFFNKIQLLVFLPAIIILSYSAWYSTILNTILSFVVYLLPIIWLKKKWYRAVIGIVLVNCFQMLSMIIKNIGDFNLFETSFLIGVILQIDTLIMALIYYLYSIRKEKI